MKEKQRNIIKISFGIAAIIAGILLEHFNIGRKDYVAFGSLGSYLIFVGFIVIAIMIIASFSRKRRIADERAYYIASEASRVTFFILIMFAFTVMIWDAVSTITIPYYLFMANLISWILWFIL